VALVTRASAADFCGPRAEGVTLRSERWQRQGGDEGENRTRSANDNWDVRLPWRPACWKRGSQQLPRWHGYPKPQAQAPFRIKGKHAKRDGPPLYGAGGGKRGFEPLLTGKGALLCHGGEGLEHTPGAVSKDAVPTGTDGSNPCPSTGESRANSISEFIPTGARGRPRRRLARQIRK
jgi:hypothetical protein